LPCLRFVSRHILAYYKHVGFDGAELRTDFRRAFHGGQYA
jgi:hypothetical protein